MRSPGGRREPGCPTPSSPGEAGGDEARALPGLDGVQIRPIRPEEYEEAGRVTAAAYREFASGSGSDWDDYLRRVADVRSRAERALVLVAVEQGRVLGSVTLELDDRVVGGHEREPLAPDEAHVRMLGVEPEARGRRLGRALMEAGIEEARRAGKGVLTLGTTTQMHAAHRLYESMGFRRGPDQVWPDGFRLLTYELRL